MSRKWVWLQLVIGWLPVWALYTLLVSRANPIHGNTPFSFAAANGFVAVGIAALLGLAAQRFIDRTPWPYPLRASFIGIHLVAATVYAFAWLALKGAVELLVYQGSIVVFHYLFLANFVLGVWLYVMVAGISYATRASARAAQAEANAARAQLLALRAQLNPHFLFNALHTVVQLIPREPRRAAQAAEQIAGLLRTTIEEDRDLVSVAEECAFVERYLDLERIRFGDRLRVRFDVSGEIASALMPSFALQTLVENAVRHGAAPRVEPTDITIAAARAAGDLRLTVTDSGAGATAETLAGTPGTGLARLRERLGVLYGSAARLDLSTGPAGFTASLLIPQRSSNGAGR